MNFVTAERDKLKTIVIQNCPDRVLRNPGNPGSGQRPLDNTVNIISTCRMWAYAPDTISLDGVMYEDYAELSGGGCSSNDAVTFDIRGYDKFEGFAGIAQTDYRSVNLTVKVDGIVVAAHQLRSDRPAVSLTIELAGHRTLTFHRDDYYPPVVIGQPRLTALKL